MEKKIILSAAVVLALLISVGSCSLINNDNKKDPVTDKGKEQNIDYLTCVNGLRDWNVEKGTKEVNWLEGVKWIDTYINGVTVDDSKVDLTKTGSYELVYKIDALDEKVENVEKKVTVTVLSKDEVKDLVGKGNEVVTQEGVQNKSENDTPKKEDIKTEDGDKVVSKPTNDNDKDKKPVEQPSNNGNSGSNKPVTPPKEDKPQEPQKPEHDHDWKPVYKTVHHDEMGHTEKVLVKEAWDEKVPVFETVARDICNTCGEDVTDNPTAHAKEHKLNGEPGGHHTEWKEVQTGTKAVHHDAEYKDKWFVDKAAWDEKVVDYYKCSCGKTKK